MKPEEFENFDFRKEVEQSRKEQEEVREERIRRPSKPFLLMKDYPSTCNSQTSNNNNSGIRSGTRSDKNIPIEELFKGNSAVIER